MRWVQSALTPRLSFALITLAFILTLPGSLVAQRNRPIPAPPPKPSEGPPPPTEQNTTVRTFEQANLEMQLLLSSRSRELGLERERRRLANQLSRDLQRLEEIDTEQIRPLASAKTLDYKSLALATGEIKDRAVRIKYNVPLQIKERKADKKQYEEDSSKLGSMLPELSRLIKSFLGNPVFRVNSPNDADLRSNAGHDLESIIKLSKTINKIAKQMSKAPVPTP